MHSLLRLLPVLGCLAVLIAANAWSTETPRKQADGNLMYSVEILPRAKAVLEVEIDARDGKALAIDHD